MANTPNIKIYGGKKSRAIRCMWMLEELNLPYEFQPVDFNNGEGQTPEYLALNPAGKVPTMVMGDFVLTESMAITLYLANKFSSPLLPTNPEQLAQVNRWTLWAVTEVEFYVTLVVREMKRGDKADPERNKENMVLAKKTVAVLETHLAKGGDYLLGSEFTVADLNTVSVICYLPMIGVNMEEFPKTAAWMGRCLSRPAWKKLQD